MTCSFGIPPCGDTHIFFPGWISLCNFLLKKKSIYYSLNLKNKDESNLNNIGLLFMTRAYTNILKFSLLAKQLWFILLLIWAIKSTMCSLKQILYREITLVYNVIKWLIFCIVMVFFCYHELNIVTVFIEISLKRSMLYEIIKVFFYQLPWSSKIEKSYFLLCPIFILKNGFEHILFETIYFFHLKWAKWHEFIRMDLFFFLLYTCTKSGSLYQLQMNEQHMYLYTRVYNMVGVDYFDVMVIEKGKTKFV